MTMNAKQAILEGKTALGIEMGSTRIKAVLIGEDATPIASGSHEWENRLADGIWTYALEDVWSGIQQSFRDLSEDVQRQYGLQLTTVGALGISGMMHGYLPLDKDGKQLAAFRTWRNTITEQAAGLLTEAFQFSIPQRWSIAHLYQAILNGEGHVKDIDQLTTLAGYVHWMLTGQRVMGVGEASGMFPIDSTIGDYNQGMIAKFDALTADKGFGWKLRDILPQVLPAGQQAGTLTGAGAKLLDPTGAFAPGIPMAPPEGDAGTGMTATNSVAQRTGNISAGTSIFAMVVLEKALRRVHTEIDMVTTPSGSPVAMVHCNNCTSDLDAWVKVFGEAMVAMGEQADKGKLYQALYEAALTGDPDAGGVVSYNYLSGEHLTGLEEGRPLMARMPDGKFTLANFMRNMLFSAMASLKIGMDILTGEERVKLDEMQGHGGIFKTPVVAQRLMASALNVPVTVMQSAGEGGPWGMALLAAYMQRKAGGETLEQFLSEKVFGAAAGSTIAPVQADREGFEAYMKRYVAGLPVEKAAVAHWK